VLTVYLRILSLELSVLHLKDCSLLLVILRKCLLFVLTIPLVNLTVPISNVSHEVENPVFFKRECKPRHHKHLDVNRLEVINWVKVTIAIVVGLTQIGYHF